jgi:vacuolar-type H+-ATPase subunit C/Vma6
MAGIMFQDITTLLLNPKAFKDTIDLFVERYKGKNISVVAGKKNKKQNSQERVKDPISAFILFFSLANFRSV